MAISTTSTVSRRKAPSAWDVRNRFSASGLFTAPTPFANSLISRTLLGGWELGFTVSAQTGTPYSVYNTNDYLSGGDYNRDGYNYDYPNMPARTSAEATRARNS